MRHEAAPRDVSKLLIHYSQIQNFKGKDPTVWRPHMSPRCRILWPRASLHLRNPVNRLYPEIVNSSQHLHTLRHRYVCMYVCVCMYACMCVYVCVCMYMCMYVCMCVCIYMRVCMYVCVYVYMHIYVCVCMYEYVRMYVCMGWVRILPALVLRPTISTAPHYLPKVHINVILSQVSLVINQSISVAWVRDRTIPTESLPLVGEVSANFCG
jgi:hypothetical protein